MSGGAPAGRPLAYIDGYLAARAAGAASDHIHVGLWDAPPGGGIGPEDFAAAQERLAARHLDAAALEDGVTLVDVGCGAGGLLRMADARLSGATLVGVNIDPRQLALCRRLAPRGGNRLLWREGEAGALPLADGVADRVASVEAAFHFPDRRRFLAEARRVLRPGGRLVFSDILLRAEGLGRAEAARAAALLARDFGPWPEPWLAPAALLDAVRAAGFRVGTGVDLAPATRAGWRFMLGGGEAPPLRAARNGLEALAALHEAGRLAYPMVAAEPD